SGCGTRIVLRGQKPLALCDRCPCFGSLFPPLAALTFAASSIICAFGLPSAAPRSPYRHLELCGIALAYISFQILFLCLKGCVTTGKKFNFTKTYPQWAVVPRWCPAGGTGVCAGVRGQHTGCNQRCLLPRWVY
ncbi:MAG: hypothetical protein PUI75_04015, partial [Subdoligranulum sp.]|nr:hypothetical protein [Subdoligranulum sp.]